MAQISNLSRLVLASLNGAPEPTVNLFLVQAVKQFCMDTGVWEHTTAEKSMGDGDLPNDPNLDYEITLPETGPTAIFTIPDKSFVYAVQDVLIDGMTQKATEGRDLFSYDVNIKRLTIERTLFRQAEFDMALVLKLQPTMDSMVIPDFLAEMYTEAITSYAISEMKLMSGREWADISGARNYRKKYLLRASEARNKVARRGTTGRIECDPLPFN